MNYARMALAGLVLPLLAAGCSGAPTATASGDDPSFAAFLSRFEAATAGFINGDPTMWKQLVAHQDDATIMGAWGAYEAGWSEVGPRYDWAAARFQDSGAQLEVEYLSKVVSGELAYTVAIERSRALVAGQSAPAPMSLRVTHVFRRQDGEWRLLHRHADPLTEKTAPATVLDE